MTSQPRAEPEPEADAVAAARCTTTDGHHFYRCVICEAVMDTPLAGLLAVVQAEVPRVAELEAALDVMRLADLRPTIYVCGPGAVKPWACGLSWTDSKGRHQSRHGLGVTPLDAVLAARALAPSAEEGGE